MSHFAVLVIGENIEEQLAPYEEHPEENKEYLEWKETESEYREEYENDTRQEFYSRNSITLKEEQFNKLSNLNVGQTTVLEREKGSGIGYFKLHDTKEAEYRDSDGNIQGRDGDVWYEVIEVLKTTHPDPDVCMEGKVRVKRIEPPRDLPLKNFYDSFEDFMENWAGYNEDDKVDGKYGYWYNPNAKWDWFQVGGRYRDRLKLKEDATGEKGKRQEQFVGSLYRESKDGWCDSALKGDIDWEAIHQNPKDYEEAIRFWEMKVEGAEPETEEEKERMKWDWYKPEFYVERYGTKKTFAKCESSFTMWAIVKDGEWIEKGEMGWFGMSGEEHDEAVEWELSMYDKFIADLPEDTRLTVVDCHI